MCNLYSLTPKRDHIGRFFRVSHNRTVAFEPMNAIFPRHVAPVVRRSEDGEREMVPMSWGFTRLEKGRAPRPITNVRDDQIRTNRSGVTASRSAAAWCRRRPSASPTAT